MGVANGGDKPQLIQLAATDAPAGTGTGLTQLGMIALVSLTCNPDRHHDPTAVGELQLPSRLPRPDQDSRETRMGTGSGIVRLFLRAALGQGLAAMVLTSPRRVRTRYLTTPHSPRDRPSKSSCEPSRNVASPFGKLQPAWFAAKLIASSSRLKSCSAAAVAATLCISRASRATSANTETSARIYSPKWCSDR